MPHSRLSQAIEAWRGILPKSVLTHSEAQEKYGSCTTPIHRHITAALIPATTEEVMACVSVANEYHVPLYPISTGNNWGYGSANPIQDDCVILDLSEMKQIIAMDPALGIVTLQPGVTQQQLYDYLSERDLPFLVPVTGAGPNCSILGNALERGYGITPYSDHFSAVTSLEAVLPDGSLYRPLLSELGGDEIDKLYKWGMGPYLDGTFTQANLGIVTQMSIALRRKPASIQAFFFSIDKDDQLEQTVTSVRDVLRKTFGVTGAINLMNSHRVLAMVSQTPLKSQGGNFLSGERLADEQRRHKVTAWTGVGAIYGDPAITKATRKVIRNILRPHVSRLAFIDSRKLGIARFLLEKIPGAGKSSLPHMLEKLQQTLDIMEGKPSEIALQLAYRISGKKDSAIKNPARDNCGLIWYSPLIPMKPDRVRRFVNLADKICRSYNIEPLITLTSLSDYCFDSTIPILYDKQDAKAESRALECYFTLYEECRKSGFLPYRLGVHSMHIVNDLDTPCTRMTKRIKNALDPNQILSPGRYCRS